MKVLLDLFWTFFKIGLFTFGGGYAMLSLIENTCVVRKEWITHDEMMDITVIAESTPGPVAINCATYVGLKKKGFLGSVAATIGVVLPSFLIILLISFFLDRFLEIKWVASAFKGIKLAVGILIVDAALKMLKKMKLTPIQVGILACAVCAMLLISFFSWNISSMVLMLAAALFSILILPFTKSQAKEGSKT